MGEIYSGVQLFKYTDSVGERLLLLEKVLGKFPSTFAASADHLFEFDANHAPRVKLSSFKDLPADALKAIMDTPALTVSSLSSLTHPSAQHLHDNRNASTTGLYTNSAPDSCSTVRSSVAVSKNITRHPSSRQSVPISSFVNREYPPAEVHSIDVP